MNAVLAMGLALLVLIRCIIMTYGRDKSEQVSIH
jgi:hypothetical protein